MISQEQLNDQESASGAHEYLYQITLISVGWMDSAVPRATLVACIITQASQEGLFVVCS